MTGYAKQAKVTWKARYYTTESNMHFALQHIHKKRICYALNAFLILEERNVLREFLLAYICW